MLGMVLEGGANRTFYSIGVLDAFLDKGIACDFFVGVSAGIANGKRTWYDWTVKNQAIEPVRRTLCC